jgi:hypothetical protein
MLATSDIATTDVQQGRAPRYGIERYDTLTTSFPWLNAMSTSVYDGADGDQVSRVAALAMKRGKSVDFTGYWQSKSKRAA